MVDSLIKLDSGEFEDHFAVRDLRSSDDPTGDKFSDKVNDKADKDQKDQIGANQQYWRDIILGVNDGLVSTFLLVAGVAGGGLSSSDILMTAIAGSVAGLVSMCAGEYVATKSQNQLLDGSLALKKHHI